MNGPFCLFKPLSSSLNPSKQQVKTVKLQAGLCRITCVNEFLVMSCRPSDGFKKVKLGIYAKQSYQGSLRITLWSQFHEAICQLYDLEPFVKVTPFRLFYKYKQR